MEVIYEAGLDADFLPRKGVVYAEPSGLNWVYPDFEGIKKERAKIKRLKKFNEVFCRRGMISSSTLAVRGLQKNVDHYKERAKKIKNDRFPKSGIRSSLILDLGECKRAASAYNTVIQHISRGIEDHPIDRSAPLKDIGEFLEHNSFEKLPFAKRDFITTAVAGGEGCGVLTADRGIMRAYRESVIEFDLENCFICNSIDSSVEKISL